MYNQSKLFIMTEKEEIRKQIVDPELPEDMKIKYLENSCYSIKDDYSFTVELSEEELAKVKTDLAQDSIELADLEEKFKAIKKEFSEDIKERKARIKETVNELRFKARPGRGRVFQFDYQDEGMMGIYNEDGRLVNVRPLEPIERQRSIMSITGRNEAANQ